MSYVLPVTVCLYCLELCTPYSKLCPAYACALRALWAALSVLPTYLDDHLPISYCLWLQGVLINPAPDDAGHDLNLWSHTMHDRGHTSPHVMKFAG